MLTYIQALILGLVQGLTELFPISSLGHAVLIADLFNWHDILSEQTAKTSYFVSLLVVLHVATAVALFIFYRKIWIRLIRAFFRSLKSHSLAEPDAKLAWLLIVATIPAGLVGVVFESLLRKQFAKPTSAIIFLMINGVILLIGDRYIRQHPVRRARHKEVSTTESETAEKVSFKRAVLIGIAQIGALCAGISRSGITMVGGLYSGLSQEDAARFSFLLATPIIFAAGIYKLPSLVGHAAAPIRGQMLLGGLAAAGAAYVAVKMLDRYFKTKTLRPFAIYCLVAGAGMLVLTIYRGQFHV